MHLFYPVAVAVPTLFEQVIIIPAIIDLVVHKLLRSQQGRIWHPFICLGDLDLLLVLMDLLQAIGVAGKFLQLIMQFFLKGNIDLIGPLGNYGNRLIQIARLCLDIGQILRLYYIRSVRINLPS